MNSMDEICVPVIKKILGHYLELNPNYKNVNIVERKPKVSKAIMAKCIRERNSPYKKNEEFRKALLDAENALRKLKAFY